jgi:hypothetical protein
LRLEAVGRVAAVGHMVMRYGWVVLVTVTFVTAAVIPMAGTPPAPDTWTLRLPARPAA